MKRRINHYVSGIKNKELVQYVSCLKSITLLNKFDGFELDELAIRSHLFSVADIDNMISFLKEARECFKSNKK